MSAPRRVLGIDPGSRITGFGVVDLHGQHRQYVASGCIRAPEGAPLPERIRAILDGIAEVTRLHQPTEAAVEQVFVNVNPASTLLLGQARGAALSALVLANLPIAEYTALQVKQSVVGNGHAGKEQVQAMVVRLLKLNGTPQAAAADALILPTLYDPFPNVCVEALACGLPLFTSTGCGAAEWIRPGENGWVRDALDVAGFTADIASWLQARADWPSLRAHARATVEPYTLEAMAEELLGLYRRLLG